MTLPWRLKYYNGSGFADAELRRWDGASWVTCDMYFWDGASWVLCTDRTPPTTTHNDTYFVQWYNSFNQAGNDSGNTSAYQGYYDGVHGIQRSMYGYDYVAIITALTGRTATYNCQIYLDNDHFYYSSGGAAVIGTHSAGGFVPSTFSYTRYNNPGTFTWGRLEAKWVYVTNDFAGWWPDGTCAGITLFADSYDAYYYGYFSPTVASLFFSYEK